jgi:HPt (histidine-containing phosphotransfer) domain-containing protein
MSRRINDHTPLVSELSDSPDLADLVEMFVSELPKRVGAMQDSLSRSDLATLASLAHQLKGAAGGYGFPTITDAAGSLERSAKLNEDIQRLTTEVRELADLCARARATPE